MCIRNCILLVLLSACQLWAQPYRVTYPEYDPTPYYGVFELGERIYRVGVQNVIEVTTDDGESWISLTPAVPQFNLIQVSASDNYAVALLSPMRWAPEDWEDSIHTSILLFTKDEVEPILLEVPWFVPVTDSFRRKLYCSVTRDAIFLLQGYSESALMRSTDLGQSWEKLPLPDSLIESNVSLIKFFDNTCGMLIGSHKTQPDKQVFVTQNEGRDWNSIPARFILRGKQFGNHIFIRVPPICWISEDSVLIVDNNNATQFSTDGGKTWSVQSENISLPRITDLVIERDNTGYLICEGGVLARTEDCGRTYQIIREAQFRSGPGQGPVTYVCSKENGRIILADEYGAVSVSEDRGISWIDQRSQDFWMFQRLQLFSMDTVFVKTLPTHFESSRFWYIRTTNSGNSWSPCLDMEQNDWVDVYFATPLVWYAIRQPTEQDSTVVARTVDAGRTWQSVYENSLLNTSRIPRGRCSLGTDIFWFATGEFLLATSDGGITWREISTGTGYSIPDQLELTDPDRCHILSSRGYMNTEDGGKTWQRFPETDQIWSPNIMTVNDGTRIYIHVRDHNLGCQRMWKSLDGGKSWDTLIVEQKDFISFGFITKDGGSVGTIGRNGEQLVSTQDEWRNYHVEDGRYGNPMGVPVFLNGMKGYIASYFSILKTTNGGINWTNVTPTITDAPRIVSTWPQPVTQGGMMSTEVELTRPGPVKIELYDLLGRRRAQVLDANVEAGQRTVQWPITGLDRGVYVLRLLTSNGAASSKIVVQ